MEALAQCMKNLTPRNNELIRLRYGKALSGIEISRIMDRKVATIYQALARIHRKLRDCITSRVQEELAS
jgi:RNA polymerase sigma-70 factor (ECF subfamily)